MTLPVLLVSGSLRSGSTNTAVLRTLAALAPADVAATPYDGMAMLPHFNPDDDAEPLHAEVAALRSSVGAAAAIVFCTPEYAGALPGSFKNLLDWTIGGGEMYGKPVAWINVSTGPTGGRDAHESLRKVLGYAGTHIVEEACIDLPVTRPMIGPDGLVDDPGVRERLTESLRALTASALATPD